MKMKVTRWYDRGWPEILTDKCESMEVDSEGFATLWDDEKSIAMFPVFRLLLVEMVEE